MPDRDESQLTEEFKAVCYWLASPVRWLYWLGRYALGFHLKQNDEGKDAHSIALTVLFFAGVQVVTMIRWEQETMNADGGEPRLIALSLYTLIAAISLGVLAVLLSSADAPLRSLARDAESRIHHFHHESVKLLRFTFFSVVAIVGVALYLGWTGQLPGQAIPIQTLKLADTPVVTDGSVVLTFRLAEPDIQELLRSPLGSLSRTDGSADVQPFDRSDAKDADRVGLFQVEVRLDDQLRCDWQVAELLVGAMTADGFRTAEDGARVVSQRTAYPRRWIATGLSRNKNYRLRCVLAPITASASPADAANYIRKYGAESVRVIPRF